MTKGLPLDRVMVHKKIWAARDRRGLVKIYQKKFAEHLGVSVPHMSRIIKELKEEGRIKKVASRYRNVGIYEVYDPKDFPKSELLAVRKTGLGPAGSRDV